MSYKKVLNFLFGEIKSFKGDPLYWMLNWGTLLYRKSFQRYLCAVIFYYQNIALYTIAVFAYLSKPTAVELLEYLATATSLTYAVRTIDSMPYYAFLTSAIIPLVMIAESGETIKSECEKMFANAQQLNWHSWNKRNRQLLLMFLVATQEPIEISCHGFTTQSREILLQALQVIHGFLTYYQTVSSANWGTNTQ
ncbi:uncharacterized protein [Diabrotica undecimpunctata]|uniref:uncharacterized protein n=1 Tax=Diabrotica undecimpunctata TaxID=50387 RepID=UPI003B633D62